MRQKTDDWKVVAVDPIRRGFQMYIMNTQAQFRSIKSERNAYELYDSNGISKEHGLYYQY